MDDTQYYFWGPLLYKTFIKDYKTILTLAKQEESYNQNLAGILNHQYIYEGDNFLQYTKEKFNGFLNFYESYYNKKLSSKEFKLIGCWINFMKEGEFNPPHVHNGDFSCVLYLDIPDLLKKENEQYVGKDLSGPGGIQFTYGEDRNHCVTSINLFPKEGDFFIFPSNLRHVVYPFKSNCTRVSMSANIKLI